MFEYRGWNKMKKVMVYDREDNELSWFDGMHITDVEMVNGRLSSTYSDYIYLLWTGTYDKNGVKIYQGDITKVGGLYEEIRFGKYHDSDSNLDLIGFYTKNKYGSSSFVSDTSEYVEVVGNIYEHTNLIL